MRGAFGALCLNLALALALPRLDPGGKQSGSGSRGGAWHPLAPQPSLNDTGTLWRCAGEDGFDATTLDETGAMLFFRGRFVWRGVAGPAEPINASWPEIQGPVDAALRIHQAEQPTAHDSLYLFQVLRGGELACCGGGGVAVLFSTLSRPWEERTRPGVLGRRTWRTWSREGGARPWACGAGGRTCSLLQGKRVWAYQRGTLRDGYPRLIAQEFRGVPADLDAAVECPPGECAAGSILFFKGPTVLSYELQTGELKRRLWPALANCSAALRWLERHYCFRGPHFLRFHPVTGEVPPHYPRDSRDYFMRCPGRGHWHKTNASLLVLADRCSGHPFQAFSSDDSGRIYAFRGGRYFRLDSSRDGWHSWALSHTWPELEGEVDAAFSWEDKLYLIQGRREGQTGAVWLQLREGPQGWLRLQLELAVEETDPGCARRSPEVCWGSCITIYRAGQGYRRVEGYPRALQEELGVVEADAAFTCPSSQDLYVIQGSHMRHVDLLQSPRRPGPALPIPHTHVDSALCSAKGVYLFHGASVHHYASLTKLRAATAPALAQNAAGVFFGCPAVAG
ncbi:hypothetical protein lerEdw1_012738 [Lerista edwardsae]|nr:hypothetical protein lerEdw1_012738 [Lerista edwardsae]